LLCCPRILDTSLGMGGGFDLIVDKLEETPHAVIFVPFRPACIYIQYELKLRGYQHVHMIRGGITHDEQTQEINAFKEARGILICTISYAESFDLETCDTSHFLGYDYSLDVNEQAEGRTQRAISKHEYVTWNYVKYMNTIDEHFLNELTEDMHNVRRVMKRPESLINALKGIRP
ncbi:MAG: helicase-related protein, partial [Nitrosopumilus sp.]